MEIIIKRLSMTNFKCFREKEIAFNDIVTTIKADNGRGKTTIADAIYFCLFGKNSEGQSDLELFKTRVDGETVHHLDCSVELELEGKAQLGGAHGFANVTLKRSIKEVWVKKRGAEETVFKNNTVEYYINGQASNKGEYESYIASIIDERVFRAITDPTYFTGLNWKDQRAFLLKLAGDINNEQICEGNEKLQTFVRDVLSVSREGNDSILQHTKSLIKSVKEKLERIPIRLEEQNKALPEVFDWSALESQRTSIQSKIKEIEENITKLQQGNGADIKRAEIRKELEEIQKKIEDIKCSATSEANTAKNEHQKKVSDASLKFNQALNDQKLMESTIEADKRLIERCKETIEECGKEREKLLAQWPNEKFTFDENNQFCPTCGQYLPAEQIAEKKEKMRQAFNLDIEQRRQSINEKGQKNNDIKAKAEEELKSYEQKLEDDKKSLEDIKAKINDIFKDKAQIEKENVITAEQILADNKELPSLNGKEKDLKVQLAAVTDSDDDKEQLESLKAEKDELNSELDKVTTKLSNRLQYDRIKGLIEGIENEEKELIKQLSELEQKEDVASLYQSRQNQILEERINRLFKLVKWKMFRTVNNGGDSYQEPYCECYVNGQPYHKGLNQADRVNAGLDICETLSNHYGITAPIVIDNAESNLHIYNTVGQQIRLVVYPSELIIE